MIDAVVGLTARDRNGKAWDVKLNESDRAKLATMIDLRAVSTAPENVGENATRATSGMRSPFVPVRELRDPALRQKYTARGLTMVTISHLILGVLPGTRRVRYLDGDPLNLVRANLNVFGPENPPVRKRRPKEAPAPVAVPVPSISYAEQPQAIPEIALSREPRDVWVVRLGKREEVFLDKQEAVNRLATLAMERVK